MANIFRRQPTIGGDNNTWATFLNAIISDATTKYSCYLYNDGGTLKISRGLIGIDNDTSIGLTQIDTVTTITLTGTTGIWQKIEMSVSGLAVTFTALDIAGKTDPAVIPTEFSTAYDAEKGGYYITSTKRCIGLVFVDSGGVLAGVINAENGIIGYYGNIYLDTAQTALMSLKKKQGVYDCLVIYDFSGWNMDSTSNLNILHLIDNTKTISCECYIIAAGPSLNPLLKFSDAADPALIAGGMVGVGPLYITLIRRTGGQYDSGTYNNASGKVFLRLTE